MTKLKSNHRADDVHQLFEQYGVKIVSFVPDAGLTELIERCQQDADMQAVTLMTEEEGMALSAGAHLGGTRSARSAAPRWSVFDAAISECVAG